MAKENGEQAQTCGTCRYAGELSAMAIVTERQFQCRRFPPFAQGLVSSTGRTANLTVWPVVAAVDWCGEYAEKT